MTDMSQLSSRHWQMRAAQRAFDRMVEEQRRAQKRDPAAALVAAAQELSKEGDFTVKDAADRAGVAVQTFYRHFGSKDELVLAVIEENLAVGTELVAAAAEGITDPLDRLEAMFRFMVSLPSTTPGLRFHARERVRLSELYAAEVQSALSPVRMLLIDALSQAAAAGEVNPLDIERDADVVMHILLSYAHMLAAHAIPESEDRVVEHLWEFCSAALRRDTTDKPHLDQRAT
jgi:AcrR family transcriptional regulator